MLGDQHHALARCAISASKHLLDIQSLASCDQSDRLNSAQGTTHNRRKETFVLVYVKDASTAQPAAVVSTNPYGPSYTALSLSKRQVLSCAIEFEANFLRPVHVCGGGEKPSLFVHPGREPAASAATLRAERRLRVSVGGCPLMAADCSRLQPIAAVAWRPLSQWSIDFAGSGWLCRFEARRAGSS